MGFADVITVLPMFLRKQAYLKRRIREERPDVLLLVDFAEFNMPLAKFAQKHGVPVVYYIPRKRGRGVRTGHGSWQSGQTSSPQSSPLKQNFTETRVRTPNLSGTRLLILHRHPSAHKPHANISI